MVDISDKRVAVLATDGFEQSELMVPKQRIEEAGAKVDVVSLKSGEIWGWKDGDWGEPIEVDRTIDAVSIDEYDALVLPGGTINPDLLRQDEDAVAFVRDFYASKKPLAAICHAPWVLIEAGIAKDRQRSGRRSGPDHEPQSGRS
jgi:protease I